MPDITLKTDKITNFKGGAILCPCDIDLTYSKPGTALKPIFQTAGKDLLKELSATGYCEIGNAIITQGYELKVKHLIFMPISDSNNKVGKMDSNQLHQSLKSAFSLAGLYKVKTLAMPLFSVRKKRIKLLDIIYNKLSGEQETKSISNQEIFNIITTLSGDQNCQSLKQIFLYS